MVPPAAVDQLTKQVYSDIAKAALALLIVSVGGDSNDNLH